MTLSRENDHLKKPLSDCNASMKNQKRYALLLIDNCSSHNGFAEMHNGKNANLEILMLQKNRTSEFSGSGAPYLARCVLYFIVSIYLMCCTFKQ